MLNKAGIALILLIGLLEPAAAQTFVAPAPIVIAVTPTGNNYVTYPETTFVSAQNFTFQLVPPLTYAQPGNPGASNLGQFLVGQTIIPPASITSDHTYTILVPFNQSHNLVFTFFYHTYPGPFFLGKNWLAVRAVSLDGKLLCSQIEAPSTDWGGSLGLFASLNFGAAITSVSNSWVYTAGSISPRPSVIVDFDQTNAQAAVNGTPTSIYYTMDDHLDAKGASIESCVNPATGFSSIPAAGGITEGYNFIPSDLIPEIDTVQTYWLASNNTTRASQINSGQGIAQCNGINLQVGPFGACIDPAGWVITALGWVGSVITFMLTHFLPFGIGTILNSIILAPLSAIIGLISYINTIFFSSGAPYGFAGFYWFTLVYVYTWGCIITAFTKDIKYMFVVPGMYFFWSIMVAGYLGYFLFWIVPARAIDVIAKIFIALTNPIP